MIAVLLNIESMWLAITESLLDSRRKAMISRTDSGALAVDMVLESQLVGQGSSSDLNSS